MNLSRNSLGALARTYLPITNAIKIAAALIVIFAVAQARAVRAADIEANADCSLADAITAANGDSNTHDSDCTAGDGDDTITLTENITLSAVLPDITTNITIEGAAYTIDGDDAHRIFNITGGAVHLKQLSLKDARALTKGAAVNISGSAQVQIESTTIVGARLDEDVDDGEQSGAAVYMTSGATLNVKDSVFRDNRAAGTQVGVGGAILMEGGTLNISNSLFNGNRAVGSGGAIRGQGGTVSIMHSAFVDNRAGGDGKGGAIDNDGATITIENSNFSGNQTSGSNGKGGAIHNTSGSLTLRHVTISDNRAGDASRGAGLEVTGGTVKVFNSIIANSDSGADCVGSLHSDSTGNLIEDGACSPALSGDPSLGELIESDSGVYYPLNADSAAIDAADATQCENLDADDDQLGTSRPQPTGGACDVGAYEWVPPTDVIFKDTACHLQDAITAANSNEATNFCPAGQADSDGTDSITLTRTTSISVEELTIDSAISIDGAGYTLTNTNTGATRRFFNINEDKSLTLKNIRLEGGSAAAGGAINNAGTLTLSNSTLVDNECASFFCSGGAIEIADDATATIKGSTFINNRTSGGATLGGAIYTQGSLTVENSTFYRNESEGGGAIAIRGDTTIRHSTFIGNSASDDGNAIKATSSEIEINLYNSVIAGNAGGAHCHYVDEVDNYTITNTFIQDKSCGVSLPATAGTSPGFGDVTAVAGRANTFTLREDSPLIDAADDTQCGNLDPDEDQVGSPRPQPTGGKCDIGAYEWVAPKNVIFQGVECHLHDAIAAANSDKAVNFCPAGSGTDTITLMTDIALQAALPEITASLTIEGEGYTISGDSDGDGENDHPIFITTGGNFTVNKLTMRNGKGDPGGALYMKTGTRSVTISNSSLIYNTSNNVAGGAVYIQAGKLRMSNSTVAFNDPGTGNPGGIAYPSGSASNAILTHVTIAKNKGGDLFGAFEIRNSIIGVCHDGVSASPNINNVWIDEQTTDCESTTNVDGDPKLGELVEDAERTPPYFPLLPGSAAIDAAAAEHCTDADQRGDRRPQGGACDIGAYEYEPPPVQEVAVVDAKPDPPFNLRIQEMSPLLAMWERPRGGVDVYLYRIRRARAESGDWAPWSAWEATRQTKARLSAEDYVYFDWQFEVRARRGDLTSDSALATWYGRTIPTTCESLPEDFVVSAYYGLASGIQCNVVDAFIVSSMPEALAALDIWGYVTQGAEVCFVEAGSLIFLDAATAPRTLYRLSVYDIAGMTCVYINRPGTVVRLPTDYFVAAPLLDLSPPPEFVSAVRSAAATVASESSDITDLEYCMVKTDDFLNLRAAPGGQVTRVLPVDVTLRATARTAGWLKASYVDDSGWISADYVTIMAGICA